MSTIAKRVIFVGPADGANHKPLNIEGVAVAAIAPGTVLSMSSSGLDASAVANTVHGQVPLIADKDQQRSKSVDDAWTIAENMVGIQPRSGEFLNVLVATAQALEIGSPLVRNGAGLLVLGSGASTQAVVGHSDEKVTTIATQLVCVRFS